MTSATKKGSQRLKTVTEGENGDIVDCQCGYQEDEYHMVVLLPTVVVHMVNREQIQCRFCHCWQHLPCYGYRNSEDPRIPEIHACYKCLLLDKELDIYRKLEGFALLRKGAHVLLEYGYNNDRQFAEAIHCNIQDAARIQKRLRREGFVEATPGSHSAGFSRTGKPKFTASKSGENRARLFKTYFEPTFEIGHHFALPERQLPDETFNTQFLPVSVESQLGPDSLGVSRSKSYHSTDQLNPKTQDIAIVQPSNGNRLLKNFPRITHNLRGAQPSQIESTNQPQVVVKSTSKRTRPSTETGEMESRSERKRLRSSRSQIALDVALRSPSPMQWAARILNRADARRE